LIEKIHNKINNIINAVQKICDSLKNNKEKDNSNTEMSNSNRSVLLGFYALERSKEYSNNKALSKTDRSRTILDNCNSLAQVGDYKFLDKET